VVVNLFVSRPSKKPLSLDSWKEFKSSKEPEFKATENEIQDTTKILYLRDTTSK